MKQKQNFHLLLDNNLCILEADDAFYEHIGQKKLLSLDAIIPPQDLLLLKNALFALDPGEGNLCCFRIRTSNGKLNWNAANLQKSDDDSGQIVMDFEDIQSLRREYDTALYDPMTGLYNKQTITDYAHEMVENPGEGFYFVLLDIDHFKRVNDTLGHKKGDEVIIDVAHMIRDLVGSNGRVGRIGGDEFMIVLDQIHKREDLREVLNTLRDTIEMTYAQKAEDALHITISVGATLYPDYSDDYEELFSLTDKLLYRAKEKGRNRYIIYTPEVHAAIRGKEENIPMPPRHIYTEKEKMRLIMDLMENFLLADHTNIDIALTDLQNAYGLDEIHVIYENNTESHYGVRRKEGSTEIFYRSFPFLKEFTDDMFNENNMLLNVTETYTELKPSPVRSYMEENKLRMFMAYHMVKSRIPGYVIFMDGINSPTRLSESDIADLVYFSRMMELVLKTR